jgi:hypothetical protein
MNVRVVMLYSCETWKNYPKYSHYFKSDGMTRLLNTPGTGYSNAGDMHQNSMT